MLFQSWFYNSSREKTKGKSKKTTPKKQALYISNPSPSSATGLASATGFASVVSATSDILG